MVSDGGDGGGKGETRFGPKCRRRRGLRASALAHANASRPHASRVRRRCASANSVLIRTKDHLRPHTHTHTRGGQ